MKVLYGHRIKEALKGLAIDEWIQLFNAETEGDLDMLKSQTKNAGILEAIDEVKTMSLSKWAKAQYDAYRKQVMDRKAREDYVRDEGIEIGKTAVSKRFLHKMLENMTCR